MVDDTEYDVTTGGHGVAEPTPTNTQAQVEVDPARAALVKDWLKKIKDAETHWEDKAFKRMKSSMRLSSNGTRAPGLCRYQKTTAGASLALTRSHLSRR